MGGPMGMKMGGFGLDGMGMGGCTGSSERAFMQALQASGVNRASITLLLPQKIVQQVLVPMGFMSEVAQRSGSQIDLGPEEPDGMRQVTLTGPMMGNALGALLLQE